MYSFLGQSPERKTLNKSKVKKLANASPLRSQANRVRPPLQCPGSRAQEHRNLSKCHTSDNTSRALLWASCSLGSARRLQQGGQSAMVDIFSVGRDLPDQKQATQQSPVTGMGSGLQEDQQRLYQTLAAIQKETRMFLAEDKGTHPRPTGPCFKVHTLATPRAAKSTRDAEGPERDPGKLGKSLSAGNTLV